MDSAFPCAEAFIPFPHIIEKIFGFLDVESKSAMYDSHQGWRIIIIKLGLWRKLAFKTAQSSSRNLEIFQVGGLNRKFADGDHENESEHFRILCLKFDICSFLFKKPYGNFVIHNVWKNLELKLKPTLF